MRRLLAIDDDPHRYEHLGRLLGPRGFAVDVLHCPACVAEATALHIHAAVLLDHDLFNSCQRCQTFAKGNTRQHLDRVAAMGVPVVVTSASSAENRRALWEGLRRRGVTCVQLSALEPDCELRWLGWLWAQGALGPQ